MPGGSELRVCFLGAPDRLRSGPIVYVGDAELTSRYDVARGFELLAFLAAHPGLCHVGRVVDAAFGANRRAFESARDELAALLGEAGAGERFLVHRRDAQRKLVPQGRIGLNARCDLVEFAEAVAAEDWNSARGILEEARRTRGGDAVAPIVRQRGWPRRDVGERPYAGPAYVDALRKGIESLTEARAPSRDPRLAAAAGQSLLSAPGTERVPYGDLLGTWKGELNSTWAHAENPYESYMVFSPRADRLLIRHYVRDGRSVMITGDVIVGDEGHRQILGIYRARIHYTRKPREPVHYGAMILEVFGSPASELVGVYWTTGETRGDLRYAERSPDAAEHFEHAQDLDYVAAEPTPRPD
ncbi:MAG TPA: hypothetical protein VF549_15470 [Solirubrobacteraceae bacterium]